MKDAMLFGFLSLVLACSNSLDGVIELRDGKCGNSTASEAYLINTSTEQVLSITVKITKNYGHKGETVIYKLNPGEELFLGCNVDHDGQNPVVTTFEVVGQVEESKSNTPSNNGDAYQTPLE